MFTKALQGMIGAKGKRRAGFISGALVGLSKHGVNVKICHLTWKMS